MDLIELRGERAKRQRSRRRRSALIALVCGAAMLGLTAGVFTVASTSRRMAEQSTRVHVLDEVLTATTIIRAQLGFGLVLTDLNGFSDVDASEAIETLQRLRLGHLEAATFGSCEWLNDQRLDHRVVGQIEDQIGIETKDHDQHEKWRPRDPFVPRNIMDMWIVLELFGRGTKCCLLHHPQQITRSQHGTEGGNDHVATPC